MVGEGSAQAAAEVGVAVDGLRGWAPSGGEVVIRAVDVVVLLGMNLNA